MKLKFLLVFSFVIVVCITFALPSAANTISVTVNCQPPNPGVYTLGWGTSRLIIPSQGPAYSEFRMRQSEIRGRLCRSGDNSGVINFSDDGSVWAYVQAN